MRRANEEFGAWVRQVRGTDSLRQSEMKTSLSYNTISRMDQGFPGTLESVVRFAEGYKQNVDYAVKLAGYEPMPELTGSQILDAGLKALGREFDRPIRISFDQERKEQLTPDEAFRTLAYYRKEVEEGRM